MLCFLREGVNLHTSQNFQMPLRNSHGHDSPNGHVTMSALPQCQACWERISARMPKWQPSQKVKKTSVHHKQEECCSQTYSSFSFLNFTPHSLLGCITACSLSPLPHQWLRLFHLCSLALFHFPITPYIPLLSSLNLYEAVPECDQSTVCQSSFLPLSEAKRRGKQRPHSSLPRITSSQHNIPTQPMAVVPKVSKADLSESVCWHLLGLCSDPQHKRMQLLIISYSPTRHDT